MSCMDWKLHSPSLSCSRTMSYDTRIRTASWLAVGLHRLLAQDATGLCPRSDTASLMLGWGPRGLVWWCVPVLLDARMRAALSNNKGLRTRQESP